MASILCVFLVCAVVGEIAASATARPRTGANAVGTVGCVPAWKKMVVPRVGYGELNAISVRSPGDAWAVGYRGSGPQYNPTGWSGSGLIEHWNGSKWSVVPSPVFSGALSDVVAISRTDAWAVGGIGFDQDAGVIEHWDGEHWVRMKNLALAGQKGLAALSGHDVWVVGDRVMLHWNGSRWSRFSSSGTLNDVVAISSRDVWAVGQGLNSGLFATHWDGRRWRGFRGPRVGGADSWLNRVTAISARNLWAVGEGRDDQFTPAAQSPVVYRWDGKWKTAMLPPQGPLLGITARSATDIWTVGWDDPVLGGRGPLISHWNGKTWRVLEFPLDMKLLDIARGKGTRLWAVGSSGNPINESENASPWPPFPGIWRYGC